MIRGQLWQLIDEDEMQRLDEAALRLLSRTGAVIRHDATLARLEAAGCTVERESGRCRFPEKLIRDVLAHFGRPQDNDSTGAANWNPALHTGHGGSFPHFLEWPDCRRRLATRQDVADMAKMAHVLPEFGSVGQVLTCAEVDSRIEPVWNAVERMSLTDKPIGGGEVLHHENIKHLVRLGELETGVPGDTSLLATCNFSVAPLIFGRRMLDCAIEKAKFRCPHVPGTMPISGISAPVTLAGTVAVCLAELIVGWVIGYLLDPDLSVGGIVASGSLDMRTLRACFGSPEAHLQDTATAQVCRRLYGIRVHVALGYVDCKTPGIEATYEKLLPLVAAPFLGEGAGISPGLLSAGQDYSPVQHLLDLDMLGGWQRFNAGLKVDDDTLALDLVDAAAHRQRPTFLDSEHTARHYASEQWYPRWLDRQIWQGDRNESGAERRMLDAVNDHWKDAVARYERPELDPGKLAEAEKILAAAEAERGRVRPLV